MEIITASTNHGMKTDCWRKNPIIYMENFMEITNCGVKMGIPLLNVIM